MYTASDKVKAQALLTANFQNAELRYREPATYKAFLRTTETFFPDYKELRTREDRAIETYYATVSTRALSGARTYNHTGSVGASGTFTPSWTPKSDKFSISMKQADKNVMSYDMMLMNEYKNVVRNFAIGTEALAVAYLFANRSSINTAAIQGAFNATTTTYEITESTYGNLSVQITNSVMDDQAYSGMLTYFCDSISYNKFRFLAAQGAQNATNYSFQFNNQLFILSSGLTAQAATLSYTKGYWVCVEDGTFSVLPWVPKQNLEGKDTKVQSYGTLINPVDNVTYALHNYEARADATATGGYEQDELEQFEVSVDLAFESAPLSNAGETVFQAFALI